MNQDIQIQEYFMMKKYNWLSYNDAKKFVSSLNLESKSEWKKFYDEEI